MKYLIGIDEVGRGPLAGPVAVGAVRVPRDFDFGLVEGAKDSKKMTPKAREILFTRLVSLRGNELLTFAVAFSSSTMIDAYGIVPAIKSALGSALAEVAGETAADDASRYEIRLDGGLRAPQHFTNQTTTIRGDDSEPVISLASIVAKVERDRLMCHLAKKYPAYELEAHKGYGTRAHRDAIMRNGLSEIHRRSFCRALIQSELSV